MSKTLKKLGAPNTCEIAVLVPVQYCCRPPKIQVLEPKTQQKTKKSKHQKQNTQNIIRIAFHIFKKRCSKTLLFNVPEDGLSRELVNFMTKSLVPITKNQTDQGSRISKQL